MKPRIAIVCEYATLNGGERSMLAVLDRLAGCDIQFCVLAPAAGPLASALRERGIAHHALCLGDAGGQRRPRESIIEEIVSTLEPLRPDLLHANSLSMGRLTGAVASRLRIPAVAHLRDIINLSRAAIDQLNQNHLLVAVSRATRDFHVAQGLTAHKTLVVYNGADCQQFQPRPATGWLKRELGLPATAFVIAAIGQIGLRKGLDVLADAAVLLSRRLPDAHYVLIGERHSTKPESVEFERAAIERFTENELGSRLHRLGYRDDVDRLLNEIDLLVHPSRQEPLGRVLLEAAAAGVPIVATRVGGTDEILEHGQSARLIPPGDPSALADAIADLAGDPEQRRRLATAARDAVAARFHIDRAAQELAHVWRDVLAGTSS